MSFNNWKKEYYKPIQQHIGSDLDAALHSLYKWNGCRRDILRKHGLILHRAEIHTKGAELDVWYGVNPHLTLDYSSCSLCRRANKIWDALPGQVQTLLYNAYETESCSVCPLFKSLGYKSCNAPGQPYNKFLKTHNVGPMIRSLEKLVSELEDYA